ncbi:WXG100 family type VII secretion target [Olsenella profusa DSM 13989]|uniref:ESAT-6-like protein n=1 Tax=Olsenella profusa F0195 TaxID=1125712 RepID=U2V1R4_9ACTN|nr:WXG100 family type VII secretion target [Olsenella profusa]ERL09277.1 type VII secretion system target protein [Olsenella profusa F0195]MDP9859129.1 WXG100 family type VII secretion target [Olsenella profusa DSM 13989]
MAGQIRITPDQMRDRATQYRTEASNVGDVIQHMDSLLQALQEEWEGSAAQAYSSRFQELRPGFVKAQDLITEIAQSLDATAQSLEETDSNIAAQFRG